MNIGNSINKFAGVVDNLNDIGRKASATFGRAKSYAATNIDRVTKSDEFVNLKSNVNKNTIVGGAITAISLVLAIKCIKGVLDKVSEYKNK